jgi:hypothetical protein
VNILTLFKRLNKGTNVSAKGENGKMPFAFNMWKE